MDIETSSQQTDVINKGEWLTRLHTLNPWAKGVYQGDEFVAGRKDVCQSRWRGGLVVWTAWADSMLVLRDEAVAAKFWDYWAAAEDAGQNDETRTWLALSVIDFSNFEFQGLARYDFSKFHFPGKADFAGAKFGNKKTRSEVNFDDAVFHAGGLFKGARFFGSTSFQRTTFNNSETCFDYAKFKRNASFFAAIFKPDEQYGSTVFRYAEFDRSASFVAAQFYGRMTLFYGAVFSGRTCFGDPLIGVVRFTGVTSFEEVSFLDRVDFVRTQFEGPTTFKFKEAKGPIDLSGAIFTQAPDFIGVELKEPPRLDNVKITTPMTGHGSGSWRWFTKATNGEVHAHYRKLRKMAIAGSDVENEVRFNAAEIGCRRFWIDQPWPPAKGAGRFWIGWLYQMLSNCGQSLKRPLLGLSILLVGCAVVFGSCGRREVIINAEEPSITSAPRIGRRDFVGRMLLGIDCQPSYVKEFKNQPAGMKWEAFLLSMRNTLIYLWLPLRCGCKQGAHHTAVGNVGVHFAELAVCHFFISRRACNSQCVPTEVVTR
jgi:uncharacterized protein YjbI with pentapeptide repeats